MDLEQHLIELSDAAAPSGFEGPARDLIRAAWEPLVDQVTVDAVGNLSALKHGDASSPRPRVMVTAHMDEIGMMVTRVDGAFLRVISLWGMDRRTLLNQPVIVHGERPLPGIIGSRPPHVLPASERSKFPSIDTLVVDTGLSERELSQLVPVGAPVSVKQKAQKLNNGLVTGKALDNRASVAAISLVLEGLRRRPCAWDVEALATVQEENSHLGAIAGTWRTKPDLAIVIDTSWAIGVGVGDDVGTSLGSGPSIIIGPNAHPKLFDALRNTASRHEIQLAVEPVTGRSGTDGWLTQVSRDGVPTAMLEIPIRNMHTPVEVVALKDIERTARLVIEFVTVLDDEFLGKMALDED